MDIFRLKLKYTKPQLYPLAYLDITLGVCMDGNEAANVPACKMGTSASGTGYCEKGVAATYKCTSGSAGE